MKIWLINHYAVPPQYYPLARPSLFAKNLMKMGHEVTIIAASTVHNSANMNLIENGEKVKFIEDGGISYVLINCKPYQGNGKNRIINIRQFAKRLPKALDALEKPDAIVATSFDPFTCYEGVKYAKKHGIKVIAEIADLWPETLIAYNRLSEKNLIVRYLRKIEKKIYTEADAIVFTMEGAYDYIVEQRWEKEVPRDKVYFINNGIDLELFDYNKEHYQIDDEDLNNPDIFKVVYAGSIRKANNLGILVDAAKLIKNERIRILVWGEGDDFNDLNQKIEVEKINNIIFKGGVKKLYIPYITSCADLNIIHGQASPILRFGLSLNKMFDYLAAGRPILIDFYSPYNPLKRGNACIETKSNSSIDIANAIEQFFTLDQEIKTELSNNARLTAEFYDFKLLSKNLLEIIKKIY